MIKQNTKLTHGALSMPKYPETIPAGCKWLGGEGYGVWFLITKSELLHQNEYRIRRYTHTGKLDCDRVFVLNPENYFFIDRDFEFAYISHCQKCTILQDNVFFIFEFKKDFDFN